MCFGICKIYISISSPPFTLCDKMAQKYDETENAKQIPSDGDGFNHRRGRPSSADRLQIEGALRSYFEGSFSASTTAKLTGFDIKTVCKYFSRWTRELLEPQNADFIKRCREEKERMILTLEMELDSLHKDRDDVSELIIQSKKVGDLARIEKLYSLKLKVTDKILLVHSLKINLINSPTVDTIISLEKEKSNAIKN